MGEITPVTLVALKQYTWVYGWIFFFRMAREDVYSSVSELVCDVALFVFSDCPSPSFLPVHPLLEQQAPEKGCASCSCGGCLAFLLSSHHSWFATCYGNAWYTFHQVPELAGPIYASGGLSVGPYGCSSVSCVYRAPDHNA